MSQLTLIVLLLLVQLLFSALIMFMCFLLSAQNERQSISAYEYDHALEKEELEDPITKPIPKVPPPAQAWTNQPTFHQLPAFPTHYSDYTTLRHRVNPLYVETNIGQSQKSLHIR